MHGSGSPRVRIVWVALGVAVTLAGCSSGSTPAASLSVASDLPVAPTGSTDPGAPAVDSGQPTPTSDLSSETGPTDATHAAPSTRRTTKKPSTTVTRTVRVTSGSTTTAGTKATTSTKAPTAAVKTLVAAESAATGKATSVHVVGHVVVGGETYGVDLHLGADGDGTLIYAGGTLGIRRVGTDLYLSADAAFFTAHKHPELAAVYPEGTWMPIDPADPAYANILPLTKVSTWSALALSAPATTSAPGTPVDGKATVALKGGTGAKANTLLLPATGAALPMLTASADKIDQVEFMEWNAAVPAPTRPTALKEEPEDAVVDVPSFPEDTAVAFSKLWKS